MPEALVTLSVFLSSVYSCSDCFASKKADSVGNTVDSVVVVAVVVAVEAVVVGIVGLGDRILHFAVDILGSVVDNFGFADFAVVVDTVDFVADSLVVVQGPAYLLVNYYHD